MKYARKTQISRYTRGIICTVFLIGLFFTTMIFFFVMGESLEEKQRSSSSVERLNGDNEVSDNVAVIIRGVEEVYHLKKLSPKKK